MTRFFEKFNPDLAQKHEGYLMEWAIRRQQTEHIAQFLIQLVHNEYTHGSTIRVAVGMSPNTMTKIQNDNISNQVFTKIGMWRLAFGIISLLPDLSVNENFKKDILGKFNHHRTYVFRNEDALKKQRDLFINAFGWIGHYLVHDLKDFSEVDKILEYYHEIFISSNNNQSKK